MRRLDSQERDALMADMKSFDTGMPCIGVFWYNQEDKSLFGVRKSELTPQMIEEAAQDGRLSIYYPFQNSQSQNDYTSMPCGCVAWNNDRFIVHVGHWIDSVKDIFSSLIKNEFNLSYLEFVYDEHWE